MHGRPPHCPLPRFTDARARWGAHHHTADDAGSGCTDRGGEGTELRHAPR